MKNRIQKTLALMLVLVMTLTALPFAAVTAAAKSASEQSEIIIGDDDYFYELDERWNDWNEETDEPIYITYAKIIGTSEGLSGDVTIPSTLGGYPVEEISGDAFSDRVNITSVVIPESVRSIEYGYYDDSYYNAETEEDGRQYGAFSRCTSLKSVTFLGEETEIGGSAFCGCTALENVNIPNKAESINNNVFAGCSSLESIVLPESICEIYYNAFDSCSSLKNINIPNNVSCIGERAFSYCTSLESIALPEKLESIGNNAFYNCPSLKSIVIPQLTTGIGSYAFYGCTSLSDISILSDKIEHIDCSAFEDTAYYKNSSNWENDVLYIGNYLIKAKEDISGDYTVKDSTLLIAEEAFAYCDSLTGVTMPDSLLYICEDAFEDCYYLSSVEFDNNLKSIYRWAFEGCRSLSEITIPENVAKIGDGAFRYCTALSKLEIKNGVKKIGSEAFWDCSSLESVFIPESVTEIYGSTFAVCEKLKSINVSANNKYYCSENGILFANAMNYDWDEDDNEIITVAKEKADLLCYPKGKTAASYSIPNSVESIDSYAFYGNESLESIDIPDTVNLVGSYAFEGCSSLKSISVPEGVYNIDGHTFSNCTSLKETNLPGTVSSISYYAFGGCTSLESINIPDGVSYIGSDAFSGCSSLKAINIPSNIEIINDGTFEGCSSLESVEIPYGVTEIEYDAFNNCTSLSRVNLPATLERVESRAFYNCPALKEVTIYAGVDEIESYAFGCYESERWGMSPVPGFTIYGFTGTAAEEYADAYGLNFVSIDGSHVHLFGDWEVTKEATVVSTGEETRTCPDCGKTQTREIEKLPSNEVFNEETGISIIYPQDTYDHYGEVSVSAEEKTSGAALDALNAEKNGKKTLFDISMYIDGEKLNADDMEGNPVWVKVPLPEGYDASKTNVYYVNDEGKLEKMKSFVDGDYVYFEAAHFSDYAIVEETEPSVNCDHICHKKGIARFFYKIARIFWKMFKKNQICKCGAYHY